MFFKKRKEICILKSILNEAHQELFNQNEKALRLKNELKYKEAQLFKMEEMLEKLNQKNKVLSCCKGGLSKENHKLKSQVAVANEEIQELKTKLKVRKLEIY